MAVRSHRREQMIDLLADVLLDQGLAAARLRSLARAIGTSDRMLLYYFKDKDELIGEALQRIAQRLARLLASIPEEARQDADQLTANLLALVSEPSLAPFLTIWLEIAALAARGDAALGRIGLEIARSFIDWIESRLSSPAGEIRAGDARRVLQAIEGEVVLRAVRI